MPSIPIFEVHIPQYKFREFEHLSGEAHRTQFGVEVPIEYWESKPDFDAIGAKIVAWLRKCFMGRRIVIRFLSSTEHPGKSIDELIEIIKQLGHDRYDPDRKGDRYENIEGKKIDIFALEIEIGTALGDYGEIEIRHALESFYTWPFQDRGKPIRVDIGIAYDLAQLESVMHCYEGREGQLKTDGYVFKNQEKKAEAVLAILKIL